MSAAPNERPASALTVRPMLADDLDETLRIKAAAFEVDAGEHATTIGRWRRQAEHLLRSDPDASFMAEREGRLVGVAQALRRERLWCLSLLAVDPREQGAGAGRALFQRSLACAASDDAALIVGSNDSRALRLYGLAGFELRPTLHTEGSVERRELPRPDPAVREAGASDLEELAAISRELRGAAHTHELIYAMDEGARLLRLADRGYAAVIPGHGVWMLAAREERAAGTLLWHALEMVGDTDRPAVRWITGGQRWAAQAALQAGLRLSSYGALCVRGAPGPLRPYLPSGPFA
jgi:ribosomal protein S18 acetylase RimI-like enzyme